MNDAESTGDWLGWHFLRADGRLGYGDGRKPKVGEVVTANGPPVLGQSGMHASKRAIDALWNATGPIACRVRLAGDIMDGPDMSTAWTREILAMANVQRTLYIFDLWVGIRALRLLGSTNPQKWNMVRVLARWLRGSASDKELRDAQLQSRHMGWEVDHAVPMDEQNAKLESMLIGRLGLHKGTTHDTAE